MQLMQHARNTQLCARKAPACVQQQSAAASKTCSNITCSAHHVVEVLELVDGGGDRLAELGVLVERVKVVAGDLTEVGRWGRVCVYDMHQWCQS